MGAVSFVQRFGSTLNAHVHFQCWVIDGVFDVGADGQVHLATLSREVEEGLAVRAAEAAVLRPENLAAVQQQVRRRVQHELPGEGDCAAWSRDPACGDATAKQAKGRGWVRPRCASPASDPRASTGLLFRPATRPASAGIDGKAIAASRRRVYARITTMR
jgi:hypothetical protein